MTQRDSRAVDLAEDGAGARDFGDIGGFAKSHLANPLAEFGITLQLANATRRMRGQLAERKCGNDGGSWH